MGLASTRSSSDGAGGIGINQQGQVALVARIDNGPDAILLLTPKSPAGTQQTP
jgi:hypothetical protein